MEKGNLNNEENNNQDDNNIDLYRTFTSTNNKNLKLSDKSLNPYSSFNIGNDDRIVLIQKLKEKMNVDNDKMTDSLKNHSIIINELIKNLKMINSNKSINENLVPKISNNYAKIFHNDLVIQRTYSMSLFQNKNNDKNKIKNSEIITSNSPPISINEKEDLKKFNPKESIEDISNYLVKSKNSKENYEKDNIKENETINKKVIKENEIEKDKNNIQQIKIKNEIKKYNNDLKTRIDNLYIKINGIEPVSKHKNYNLNSADSYSKTFNKKFIKNDQEKNKNQEGFLNIEELTTKISQRNKSEPKYEELKQKYLKNYIKSSRKSPQKCENIFLNDKNNNDIYLCCQNNLNKLRVLKNQLYSIPYLNSDNKTQKIKLLKRKLKYENIDKKKKYNNIGFERRGKIMKDLVLNMRKNIDKLYIMNDFNNDESEDVLPINVMRKNNFMEDLYSDTMRKNKERYRSYCNSHNLKRDKLLAVKTNCINNKINNSDRKSVLQKNKFMKFKDEMMKLLKKDN